MGALAEVQFPTMEHLLEEKGAWRGIQYAPLFVAFVGDSSFVYNAHTGLAHELEMGEEDFAKLTLFELDRLLTAHKGMRPQAVLPASLRRRLLEKLF